MVVYTGNPLYWAALKPRIKIYAFSDTTYSSALYSYDPFTDAGTTDKPISLRFETLTTNAGTFSLEIEDTTDGTIDPDVFMKGNRVVIDCSKDGVTYQPAFKGLIRSLEQRAYGATGKNIVLSGYSYLVRLNERIVNIVKQSSLAGTDYDRTDSTMFTNNLMNDLLTTDSNYVYSVDDTALYSVFKTANITSSSITDWVPRVDAQLTSLNDAVGNIIEFSNSLVTMDVSNDQLMLYNPDRVTSSTGVFLLTNQMNQIADDADITMYPIDNNYSYNVSYDYPDSGNRLIASIGNNVCGGKASEGLLAPWTLITWFWDGTHSIVALGQVFQASAALAKTIQFGLTCVGNVSAINSVTTQFATVSGTTWTPIGGDGSHYCYAYRNSDPSHPAFPSSTSDFIVGYLSTDTTLPTLTAGNTYWVGLKVPGTMSNTQKVGWIENTGPPYGKYAWSYDNMSTWTFHNTDETLRFFRIGYASGGPCGGIPVLADADPLFAVAQDKNTSNRMGIVEKVMSSLPTHVRTLQTMNEYMFNKLYTSTKPRFTFDFPAVTMPNKVPKAGDIVVHIDKKAGVGTKTTPIQTGVISSVSYDFSQNTDDVLGLRKLALTTTGIRRGYY